MTAEQAPVAHLTEVPPRDKKGRFISLDAELKAVLTLEGLADELGCRQFNRSPFDVCMQAEPQVRLDHRTVCVQRSTRRPALTGATR